MGAVFEWRSGRLIELTLGENTRTIDHRINELFARSGVFRRPAELEGVRIAT